MGRSLATLSLALSFALALVPEVATAQDEPPAEEPTAVVTAVAVEPVGGEPPLEERMPDPSDAYRLPHPSGPRDDRAPTDIPEAPEEVAPPDDAPSRGFELAWMASGAIALGIAPSLGTEVGLFIAASPQWWLGPVVSVRYDEAVFRSSPSDYSRNANTNVSLGVTLQHYFEEPRTGAVLATLHATFRGGYSSVLSESVFGGTRSAVVTELMTGGAQLEGGATWMPEPWLAGRLIGGLDFGFATTIGNTMTTTTNVTVGVLASIGVVVRL